MKENNSNRLHLGFTLIVGLPTFIVKFNGFNHLKGDSPIAALS